MVNKYTTEIITESGGTFINLDEIAALVRYEGAVDVHMKSGTIFTAKLFDNEVLEHDELLDQLMEKY